MLVDVQMKTASTSLSLKISAASRHRLGACRGGQFLGGFQIHVADSDQLRCGMEGDVLCMNRANKTGSYYGDLKHMFFLVLVFLVRFQRGPNATGRVRAHGCLDEGHAVESVRRVGKS